MRSANRAPHSTQTTRQATPASSTSLDHESIYGNTQLERPHERPEIMSKLVNGMASFRNYPHVQETSGFSSQDSTASVASSGGAISSLPTSTNVSQTTLDTAVTSPMSPRSVTDYICKNSDTISQDWKPSNGNEIGAASRGNDRLRTPEEQTDAPGREHSVTTPMSISTPGNGLKRTANGAIKSAGDNVLSSPLGPGQVRGGSVSSTGSKAGEVSNLVQ